MILSGVGVRQLHARQINILAYHSLSDGPGPTCITPTVFRRQMAVLAECGYRACTLADVLPGLRGESELDGRTVVLTFDDGFQDFAEVAYPELAARGWRATVFLPAGKMGGTDDWEAHSSLFPPRPLMNWQTVAKLARSGIEFGGHGVTHRDLTALSLPEAEREIDESKERIEANAGTSVVSFAPPFGKSDPRIQQMISSQYQASCGTTLARAGGTSNLFDLPRIEMWYFRNARNWRAYLQGSQAYFLLRKTLRYIRGWATAS